MSGAAPEFEKFLARRSFIELSARERARAILDDGSYRELLGPFERLKSPWLALQGIVQQADDGVVIARGRIGGSAAVVAAIEGAYLGGSIGEVSGSKIAAALELALDDCERRRPVLAVLLLESGGVRLQEANLGLAVIAEIHAAIVPLRRHVPVIGVIAGMVGCFGGMSLAAGLCSHLIVTRQARLGISGPEVIEQEAGAAEMDASDRALIWSVMGGEQRYVTDLADSLLDDDVAAVVAQVRTAAAAHMLTPRSADLSRFLSRGQRVDADEPRASTVRQLPGPRRSDQHGASPVAASTRGRVWFQSLTGSDGLLANGPRSILVADAQLGNDIARFLAVVPDAGDRSSRARHGELGLEQAATLAQQVRDTIRADEGRAARPIIAIVAVPSQAYGRHEERLGIHLACAAAVDAYVTARLAGHPIVALVVGKAMAGAVLAHGYQANRILALDAPDVVIHAMSQQAAARVTRRSLEELERLSARVAPMAYNVRAYASLGLLHALIDGVNADDPAAHDVARVRGALIEAVEDIRRDGVGLSCRLSNASARQTRAASIEVRQRLAEQWHGP